MDRKRNVLITGASGGIGTAIANKFLQHDGYRLVLLGNSEQPKSQANKVFRVDFDNPDSLSRFLDLLPGLEIDILINNAGINIIKPTTEISDLEIDRLININLIGPIKLSQAVLPHMVKTGWGRIVNIASIWSILSKKYRMIYSASKAGLDGVTKGLSAEYASEGILVNTISPGFTDTDLTRNSLNAHELSLIEGMIPVGNLAAVSDIADVVFFVGSEGNNYISGQNIVVDGGFSIV